jgi:transposase
MKENPFFANYIDLSQDELKQLPVDELARVLYELLQEWKKLHQRLNQDSTNSSKAPSTDGPEAKARRKAEKEAEEATPSNSKHGMRKQGAQPGHRPVEQPFIPIEEVETIEDCKPDYCAHCGHSLEGEPDDPNPYRKQFFDFEIIIHAKEIRQHSIECPYCGEITKGTLPKEARGSIYSPNIVALVGVLTGLYQISRRMTAMFIKEMLGIPISVGSVSNLEKELTESTVPVMEEIEIVAQNAEQGNADETGFGMANGKQGWLWVLVTPLAVLFRLLESRSGACARRILGSFEGILTSDRYAGYNWYDAGKRQLCWAHLKRDFKAMCELGAAGEAIGKGLLKQTKLMFRLWHRFKKWKESQEGKGVKISMTVLESQMGRIRKRILALLEEGKRQGIKKCEMILKVEELLWTFLREEGVEPTNNAAERAMRPAVLWKKRSFGVESERGARYVESMLSIWMTSRLNGVNPIQFLRELVKNSRSTLPTPSIFNFKSR